ncbi:MAG: molecular chaperone HtpG [Pseudomonadota bacterium]
MSPNIENFQFKAETQKLLDIVINSLYSEKEIFLRELISNASDAIDKLRFRSLTDKNAKKDREEFEIFIEADKKNKRLMITDNGIGMTKEELIDKIGTIAKSGSEEFVKLLENRKDLPIELIGQFGVGFYSAFMVSKLVTIITKHVDSEKAYKWESKGDGSFTVEDWEKDSVGTTVILDLKSKKDNEDDYTDDWKIRSIIKKHSDFISYPITMNVEKEETSKGEDGKEITTKKIEKETLNSKEAIWARNKSEIKQEEYDEFYKHISHDWEKPLDTIHLSAEGRLEYKALLFIPSKKPFHFSFSDRDSLINLYVKKILIMDDCKDLLPSYLRFVKGLVDASDLSLNVSREMLQNDRRVASIRSHLTKKVLESLTKMKEKEFDKYKGFFTEFGLLIKEGIYSDMPNKEKLMDLVLFKSTKSDELISLETYVKNMKEDQKEIYYITGDNIETIQNSPHLEAFKKKDIEVLYFVDHVDEFVLGNFDKYKEKEFKSVLKTDVSLDENEKESTEKAKEKFDSLLAFMKEELSEHVKDVKFSTRLTDSVACLVSDKDDPTANMERILKATGQAAPKSKRILELNADHILIEAMNDLYSQNKEDEKLKNYCELIFDQALLTEGSNIKDPAKFSKLMTEVMIESLGKQTKSRIII